MTSDLPVWIGVIVAGVIGAIGWIFAGVANGRAKTANSEATKSNIIAKDALDKADQANRIAEHANELSKEANKLVERSVAEQTEDWFVDWRCEWNKASASVVLKNRGAKSALDASVIIVSEDGIYQVQSWPEGIAANTDAVVEVTQVIENRTAHAVASAKTDERMRVAGIVYVPSPYRAELSVSIRWRTGEGFPRDRDLKLDIS